METLRKDEFWNKIFHGELESNRFAIITIVLLVVGCIGGIAVGMGSAASSFQLSVIVLPTMVTLSLLLAVAPLRYILSAALLTILIDTILIVLNIV